VVGERVKALERYRVAPARVRLHTRLRAWSCPLDGLVSRVAPSGRVLDVGCGHGLLSIAVAETFPETSVLGVDPAEEKLHWARRGAVELGNVGFVCGTLEAVSGVFDTVVVVDVLYLVARAHWPGFLRTCRERLRPGGRLLLKEVDVRPRWKFFRCVAQETLSVRLLGITLGRSFAFLDRLAMTRLLDSLGFAEVAHVDLGRGYMTPHVLYQALRP
jgi:2-polyprenyl-6-hydroxyphenyl methylase/3-demethylubiquinone-9 3-methyltransferase